MSETAEKSIVPIAHELGIRPKLLYRRRSEYRAAGAAAFPGHDQLKAEEAEITALRREWVHFKFLDDVMKAHLFPQGANVRAWRLKSRL
ncbi:MAG: transposase [Anaerolineae bacterium]